MILRKDELIVPIKDRRRRRRILTLRNFKKTAIGVGAFYIVVMLEADIQSARYSSIFGRLSDQQIAETPIALKLPKREEIDAKPVDDITLVVLDHSSPAILDVPALRPVAEAVPIVVPVERVKRLPKVRRAREILKVATAPVPMRPAAPKPEPIAEQKPAAAVVTLDTKPKPVRVKPAKPKAEAVTARREPVPLLIPRQPMLPASATIAAPAPIAVVTGPDGRVIIKQ